MSKIGSAASEKSFKNVNGRTHGRRTKSDHNSSSNIGPEASEEVVCNNIFSQHVSHINEWCPYKCIGKQT